MATEALEARRRGKSSPICGALAAVAGGTPTISQIDGVLVYGLDLRVDDITVGPAARKMVRHGGAEWTPGASSFPSGGVAFDEPEYKHRDYLGNTFATTGADGLTTGSGWSYDAFGNVLSGTTSSYEQTGNQNDPDIGLFYFNNRWYDADLGRFTQRNTPFQPLWEHPYAISEGNPVNFVDPGGYGSEFGFALNVSPRPGETKEIQCKVNFDHNDTWTQETEDRIRETFTSPEFLKRLEAVKDGYRHDIYQKLQSGELTLIFPTTRSAELGTAFKWDPSNDNLRCYKEAFKEGVLSDEQLGGFLVHEVFHSTGHSHGTKEAMQEGVDAGVYMYDQKGLHSVPHHPDGKDYKYKYSIPMSPEDLNNHPFFQ
jgi:RHS repeat-associated protein